MTTTTLTSQAARRFTIRVQGMLDDPECVGDLLALGIAMAETIDLDAAWRDDRKARSMRRMSRRSLSTVVDAVWKARDVIRRDIRRYDTFTELPNGGYWSMPCGAPMVRRAGTCGQRATNRTYLVDLDTGRARHIGSCGRPDHKAWLQALVERNRQGCRDCPPPRPAANTGGVLARHLPEIDWDALYREIEPRWSPPPEDAPWRRPTLTLHLGAEESDEPADRPALAVVPGAGEGINIDGAS